MYFEFDYEKVYTTTLTSSVGPTTDPTSRQALPQPAPSDANAIWLAKNGRDTDPGTEALPKLTIGASITALTAGKPTVHIFRNGYVGKLSFSESGLTLPASRNIQVELGEVAYIASKTSSATTLTCSGTNTINGLIIYAYRTSSGSVFGMLCVGADITIENCDIVCEAQHINAQTVGVRVSSTAYTNCNLKFSIVRAAIYCVESAAIASHENSIFYWYPAKFDTSQSVVDYAFSGLFTQHLTVTTTTLTQCLFSGLPIGVSIISVDSGTANETDLDGCIFEDCNASVFAISDGDDTRNANINMTFCLNRSLSILIWSNDVTRDVDIILTNINEIPNDWVPLYVDYDNALNEVFDPVLIQRIGNQDGFRLQFKGKLTPDETSSYFVDSPLIDAFASTEDVNPWIEDTTLVSQSYTKNVELKWDPAGYQKIPRFINAQSIDDIRGNPETAYDSIRRRITFNFGGGDRYANNNDMRKLLWVASQTGSIRFYERGLGETLFRNPLDDSIDSTTGALVDNGITNTRTFTPVLMSGNEMITHNWAGYWLKLLVSGVYRHFYISANDETTLTLVDKVQVLGFPADGSYGFTVEYLLVKPSLQDFQTAQEFFTNFKYGGGNREGDDDETYKFEFSGYSITLNEVESNKTS